MPSPHPSHLATIDRRNWWLWIVTLTVLVALTVTVSVLYAPLLDFASGSGQYELWIRDGYYAGVGLSGLVLLFCLYIVFKQRQLIAMRGALQREQSEREDMRTRLSEISALFGMTTTLNLQLKLDTLLEIMVRRVVSTLSAQQASVMIYTPESGVLETRATYGLESEYARNGRLRLGEGIAGWVAQRQEAILLGADEPNQTFRQHYKRERHITSALSLPLRVGDRCVGVLNVARINHPDPFREHHRDLLRMFAEHVGSVIERAETMERLAARTQVLEASNLQLAELNLMKDTFLSTASHELKTPLTSVIAYAEMLQGNPSRLSDEQRDEFLRRLNNEANALLSLIDDILDLSRLENGKLVLERKPHALNEIVRVALDTARPMAEKHGVALVESLGSDLPGLEVDEGKMRQVMVNLLVNAIKFTPSGSRVTVRTRLDHQFVVVEVSDQGPGVRPDEAVHIFELFGQGARHNGKQVTGVGIGLHLVKRLTELHGGHVGVESRLGQGSTFWVRLAASPIAVQALAA
jgi:signal transduction histidine kinase